MTENQWQHRFHFSVADSFSVGQCSGGLRRTDGHTAAFLAEAVRVLLRINIDRHAVSVF